MKPHIKFCSVFYNEFRQDTDTGVVYRNSPALPIERSFDRLRGNFDWSWRRVRATYIARGRNALINLGQSERVRQSPPEDYTHYCFVDSDISGFERDRIVERLLAHDLPIVSAAYMERKSQSCYCAGRFPVPPHDNQTFLPRTTKGLQEVDWVGAGFLLIKREVFENLAYPWFQFTELHYRDSNGQDCVQEEPEDLSFCRKAKAAGYSINIDCDCIVTHNINNIPNKVLEGFMEKLTMKKAEVRALYFGISQIINSGVKDSHLKYGLSRCKKALQPAVEALDEVENSDEGIKAYREELKNAKVVDESGKITDKKVYAEITERHKSTLEANRDWLKTITEVDIYKIAHECTSEISSDLYDLIFPIIQEPKAEDKPEVKEAA